MESLVRTVPPFRADHVGSLLRPPALLAARERHAAGELDDAGLLPPALLASAVPEAWAGARDPVDRLPRARWAELFAAAGLPVPSPGR